MTMEFLFGLASFAWIMIRIGFCAIILMPIGMISWILARSFGAQDDVKKLWDTSLDLIWYDMRGGW